MAAENQGERKQSKTARLYSDNEGLMTAEDVIAYLRLPSKQSLYAMTSEQRIPHFKIIGRLRFWKHEIDQWIESQRVEAPEVMGIIREKIAV